MKYNGVAYEEMPDKVLMAAFKEGDEIAYSELCHRFEPRITSFLLRFQNGFSRAVKVEDIVQEAFIKLYTHGHLYNEQTAEFSTWLFTIAANLSRTEIRKTKRRNTDSLDGLWEDMRGDFSIDDVLYGGDLTREIESREYVDWGMQKLQEFVDEHPVFGTVLLLRGFHELEYQIIADIMNIPIGTVKSRINRARVCLRNGSY